MDDEENKHSHQTKHEPSIAPGMEMDELDEPATKEEISHHDSTSVTKLFIDRIE